MATDALPAVLPNLYIEHNHGHYELKDATLVPQAREGCFTARGTVVSGGEASRLFHATSYRAEPVGEVREYDIWNRRVYETGTPGHYRVSICFC
jgi:hypothetical protein